MEDELIAALTKLHQTQLENLKLHETTLQLRQYLEQNTSHNEENLKLLEELIQLRDQTHQIQVKVIFFVSLFLSFFFFLEDLQPCSHSPSEKKGHHSPSLGNGELPPSQKGRSFGVASPKQEVLSSSAFALLMV
jgi:hypothetical protein